MPKKAVTHTPGPWETSSNGTDWDVCQENAGDMIADLKDCPNAQANARLIAAAPDLLTACRCALADLEGIMPEFEPDGDRTHPGWETIKDLKRAIKKAGSKL